MIISTGFTGCKKDKCDYTFEGKWELGHVNYMDSAVVLHGDHSKPWIDFVKNINITYDFQKNNKLVITSISTSGELQQNEHTYTYIQEGSHPYSNPPVKYEGSYTLHIDTFKLRGFVYSAGSRILEISGFCAKNKVIIDEIDLDILKYDGFYYWQKRFYELK
ncbi:MAG: hypothetical protein LBI45_07840 [Bacteroidales bacterium]|nr:hypothetical protein [Bacteroidales bacterium]